MIGFTGRSYNNVDSKGRIHLPVRFKEVLEALKDGRMVITNEDRCLSVYPAQEWERIEKEVYSRYENTGDPELRDFIRYFISAAVSLSLDNQGRILIPVELRSTVSIDREVVLMGVGDHFEIWSSSVWRDKERDVQTKYASIAPKALPIPRRLG